MSSATTTDTQSPALHVADSHDLIPVQSNPATYTGLLDPIRKAFATSNGVKPALFSANSEGACPNCNGLGAIYTDLAMMAGVATTCEECEGKRFQASVLEYHLGGRDISEVLAMSVTEAEGVLRRRRGAHAGRARHPRPATRPSEPRTGRVRQGRVTPPVGHAFAGRTRRLLAIARNYSRVNNLDSIRSGARGTGRAQERRCGAAEADARQGAGRPPLGAAAELARDALLMSVQTSTGISTPWALSDANHAVPIPGG